MIDCEEVSAVDVPHRCGLGFADVVEALRVFVTSPSVTGVVITEFNAELDPEGDFARRLVWRSWMSCAGSRSLQARASLRPRC